ncbi:MAG TPA: hypothetical protein VHW66_19470 [Stellaceae bacterium]|jgi:hypothetical protein|nr:hypothetical protein [Stellaceae bacterium]
MFTKYVGLTADTAELVERLRATPTETEDDIIRRALTGLGSARSGVARVDYVVGCDLGSGVSLAQNERIQCYIRTGDMTQREFDGFAVARNGGLFIGNDRVVPQRGAWLQAALKIVQRKIGHVSAAGGLVSLDAWEHWFVIRDGKQLRLGDLRVRTRIRRRRSTAAAT